MDHDYEIAVYDREELLFDVDKLHKPSSYHAEIHPTDWEQEEQARAEKAAKKAAAQAAKKKKP
jgi:formate hydrogenlyase subunit 6/NADH:ubiquinone oxidoreductase subunit I